MTRTIRSLGPLALAALAVGALTLWLLGQDPVLGGWLLAAILFGHGWVHMMFLFPRPAAKPGGEATGPDWPFDLRDSWLIQRAGLAVGTVTGAGRVLVVATFALSTLAALATIGILVPVDWWTPLVVCASMASAALLVVTFTPMLLLGLGIDIALVWLAIAGPWSPS